MMIPTYVGLANGAQFETGLRDLKMKTNNGKVPFSFLRCILQFALTTYGASVFCCLLDVGDIALVYALLGGVGMAVAAYVVGNIGDECTDFRPLCLAYTASSLLSLQDPSWA